MKFSVIWLYQLFIYAKLCYVGRRQYFDRHSGIFMCNNMFIELDMLVILKKMFMTFDWISLGCFLAVRTLQRATTTVTGDIVVISQETHDTVAERLQLEVELSLHVHYCCKQTSPLPMKCCKF